MLIVPDAVTDYDESGTRRRHVRIIRHYLGVKSFDEVGQAVLSTAVRLAAERMEDLADIIKVAIEELIRASFELPGFSTLHKEAKRGRAEEIEDSVVQARQLALAVWTMAHGFAMLLSDDAFARTKNVTLIETDARQMLAINLR